MQNKTSKFTAALLLLAALILILSTGDAEAVPQIGPYLSLLPSSR